MNTERDLEDQSSGHRGNKKHAIPGGIPQNTSLLWENANFKK
jgi:hypothetical protein